MATGNITVAANISGGPDGTWSLNSSFVASTAVQAETVVSLSNGSSTVSVPTGCTAAIIVPPNAAYPAPNPTWSGTLTLKGSSGDTGVPISTKYSTPILWDSATAPASIVLTATASGTAYVRFM